jgi:hypothetical protein
MLLAIWQKQYKNMVPACQVSTRTKDKKGAKNRNFIMVQFCKQNLEINILQK